MRITKLILVGASTGGPRQLKILFHNLQIPENVAVIVAQHMSLSYIPSFVEHFAQEALVPTQMLTSKEFIKNKIYICKENTILSNTQPLSIFPSAKEQTTTFNPNINMLFSSAVAACESMEVMGILLTGIGDDGAKGLFDLYKAGAVCVAEDKDSCVVYGMPKRAKELNPDLQMLSIKDIRFRIERFLNG